MISNLIGQRIKIIKRDGYVKFGKLLDEDHNFIKLLFMDGREELINKEEISSMAKDEKGVDV
jgi:hypothetical protein